MINRKRRVHLTKRIKVHPSLVNRLSTLFNSIYFTHVHCKVGLNCLTQKPSRLLENSVLIDLVESLYFCVK